MITILILLSILAVVLTATIYEDVRDANRQNSKRKLHK
jgi:hypothetical protein